MQPKSCLMYEAYFPRKTEFFEARAQPFSRLAFLTELTTWLAIVDSSNEVRKDGNVVREVPEKKKLAFCSRDTSYEPC